MSRYYDKKRLIPYLIFIFIAVFIIYYMGWEEEGELKNKIRHFIRTIT